MYVLEKIANAPARNNMNEGYRGVYRLHDDIDRLFNGFFQRGAWPGNLWPEFVSSADALAPQLDVTSDDKAYVMNVELPGVDPEAVTIKVSDNVLSVSGEKRQEVRDKSKTHVQERSYGSFTRSLTLPEDADMENIRAVSKNGVLSIEIPRKSPDVARTRTIEIQKA